LARMRSLTSSATSRASRAPSKLICSATWPAPTRSSPFSVIPVRPPRCSPAASISEAREFAESWRLQSWNPCGVPLCVWYSAWVPGPGGASRLRPRGHRPGA
jgi:hypothetical protein